MSLSRTSQPTKHNVYLNFKFMHVYLFCSHNDKEELAYHEIPSEYFIFCCCVKIVGFGIAYFNATIFAFVG